jgi:hypothetical protein
VEVRVEMVLMAAQQTKVLGGYMEEVVVDQGQEKQQIYQAKAVLSELFGLDAHAHSHQLV